MAAVETLRWGLEILRILTSHTLDPLTLKGLRDIYPDVPPTTLKNRMQSVVDAGYARKLGGGWVLEPDTRKIFEAMKDSVLGALIQTAKRAEQYGANV